MQISRIEKAFEKVFTVFRGVQIICLIAISALMFLQVIMREVFNTGSQWVFEICTFLQVTMVWMGVPVLLHRNEDIRISFIYDRVPLWAKQFLDIMTYLIIVASAGMMTWGYSLYLKKLALIKSAVMRLPNYIYFGSLMIGIFFVVLVLIFKAVKVFQKFRGGRVLQMNGKGV